MMSDEGDIDVESAEDVPDVGVEATATTTEDRSDLYSPTVSMCVCVCESKTWLGNSCTLLSRNLYCGVHVHVLMKYILMRMHMHVIPY